MGNRTCSARRGFNKYAEFWWGISLENEYLRSVEGDGKTKYEEHIKLLKSESTV